jgi:RNA polymerase sigma-70 factor (ECF subfamily)
VEKRPLGATSSPAEAEAAFVEACRAGDPRALDQFFRKHVSYVERVIGRLIGPTADLEDLVQTTFIEAMKAFCRYRGEANLKTWVTRIAVHVTLRQLRRGLRRHVPLELLPAEDEPHDGARSVDRELDDRRIAVRLHHLLDRITPKKRVAFLLHTVEGHSIEEVAALTGAGRAATKSRIWFARRELLALVRNDPALRDLVESLKEETTCR